MDVLGWNYDMKVALDKYMQSACRNTTLPKALAEMNVFVVTITCEHCVSFNNDA